MRPKPSGVSSHSLRRCRLRRARAPSPGPTPGLAVDVDARVGLMALGVPVGGQQRGLDRPRATRRPRCPCRPRSRAERPCRCSCFCLRSALDRPRQLQLTLGWRRKLNLDNGFRDTVERRSRAPTSRGRASSRTTRLQRCRHGSRRPDRSAAMPSDRVSSTLRPRARRKCFSVVSGRSTPGEVTSRT